MVSILLLVCITLAAASPVMAADHRKIIRVGYIGYENFISQNERGGFEGYGVEYLNEISNYANVKYEYEYDTWTNCLQKLKNHEIDLVCCAKYIENRTEDYEYSKQIFGNMEGVLYTQADNTDLYYNDYAHMDGSRIAFLQGSLNNGLFQAYADDHKFSFTPVYYNTPDEMADAVQKREVTAMATDHLARHDDFKLIGCFNSVPFYLMSYKGNDIMDTFNDAMAEINIKDSTFESNLFSKYYGKQLNVFSLTREEAQFIADSGEIVVGQIPNRFCISHLSDDGVLTGINEDILQRIAEISGLKLVSAPIPVNMAPLTALETENFDAVMGVIDNPGFESDMNIILSDSYITSRIAVVMKKGEVYDPAAHYTVGVKSSFQFMKEYMENNYPQYRAVLYDTTPELLDAIRSGDIDIMMENIHVTNYLLQKPVYSSLEIMPTSFVSEEDCLAIRTNEDPLLMSIINKAINNIDTEEINNIILANTTAKPYQFTLADSVYKYRIPLILGLMILGVTIVSMAIVQRTKKRYIQELTKKNEQLTEAVKQSKNANMAKGQFLSTMSHDMRTPLNAIISYSGDTMRKGATESQKDKYLDDIHSSGMYLLGIINDVLDMSKIESRKMELHPETYTCAEFKTDIETVVLPLCRDKGITFKTEFPENIYIPMKVDKLRFNQIFINLLSNAIKFTPEGGTVTLKAEKTKRDGVYDEVFTVSDTGCGMTEEFLPHAFDSFSQEQGGQSMHHEQGTGLGLSIVKQLVELMGGTISAESTLGKGTTFTVNMTLSPADMEQRESAVSYPERGLNQCRILLCEDHPMNRKIAVKILEKEGCIVTTAEDGLQGVECFRSSALDFFDAILMDIRMPNMDGLEATKAIRALPREDAGSVPIIAMTANAFAEDRKISMDAGMNAHIGKPVDISELYQTLYHLISNRHVSQVPKILVVDDIEMNAALVAKALSSAYETIIASSGAEALERLRMDPYIIAVITDVQMPDMDGETLIRKIRQTPAYKNIAVIANTEFGNSHMEDSILKSGADDFIYKPTAPSVILSRVKNVLGKYR